MNVSGVKVSALYRDASIGNAINIVMVRLMLLENESLEVGGACFYRIRATLYLASALI